MIKKFKNGKIKLISPPKDDYVRDRYNDNKLTDLYYHDYMFMEDLYFEYIDGYVYLIDYNTNLVYELESQSIQNPIKWILDILDEDGKYYLYPLPKEDCKILLDLMDDNY